MSLTSFFRRHKAVVEPADDVVSDGPVQPTKALSRFLAILATRPQPVLLDIGPVVGRNVTFFGEQLGCKVLIEDVCKDIDSHVSDGTLDRLPAFFATRFQRADESIDGILGWDVFDYLDRPAIEALARELGRLLKPECPLLAFFSTSEPLPAALPTHTRHVVVDSATLQPRPYPAARGRQRPLLNRDIQRFFEPLRITDQFLLKTNMREVLFRKPGATRP